MGNVFSNCSCKKHRISTERNITLLMIGLDNAGKTCTVKHLLGETTADSVPTIGFSSISLRHGKFNITIYDLGGGPKIRGIWKKYYALVHGLIFVVDASDPQRLEECQAEIKNVLTHEKIAGKPMLMLVNKQDVNGAMDEAELVSQLDLEVLVNEQKCPTRVEASCAIFDETKVKDPGIQEGFNWLIGIISRDFDYLYRRVEEEMREQKKQEEIEQTERMKRVQKIREERERLAAADNSGHNHNKDDCNDDDDDVIIGNPFKSCDIIKAELEERERLKATESTTPTVKVIHVSPTNSSEASNREEVILLPQPLNNVLNEKVTATSLHNIPLSEMGNGSVPLFTCDEEESKKKSKKSKKRFKNRIVPELHDTNSISHISRLGELPPIRPSIESVGNGQPCVYVSPKRNSHKNGTINWALAEELEPCRDASLAGCSNKRIEAWSDGTL